MHRASCFEELGYWPEDMEQAGDWELWRRILKDRPGSAIGFERRPTQLHFKAGWRNTRFVWPRFLAYLSAMADSAAAWHGGLRLPVSPQAPLQETTWARMAAQPDRFAARLRNGVNALQDRLAWRVSRNSDFL